MRLKELPVGKIGIITRDSYFYGRAVANIDGKHYMLDQNNKFLPLHNQIADLIVRVVGDYNENVCDAC